MSSEEERRRQLQEEELERKEKDRQLIEGEPGQNEEDLAAQLSLLDAQEAGPAKKISLSSYIAKKRTPQVNSSTAVNSTPATRSSTATNPTNPTSAQGHPSGELATLNAVMTRIQGSVPAAPYVLTSSTNNPFRHYAQEHARQTATAFRAGGIFDYGEEGLQYMSFCKQSHVSVASNPGPIYPVS